MYQRKFPDIIIQSDNKDFVKQTTEFGEYLFRLLLSNEYHKYVQQVTDIVSSLSLKYQRSHYYKEDLFCYVHPKDIAAILSARKYFLTISEPIFNRSNELAKYINKKSREAHWSQEKSFIRDRVCRTGRNAVYVYNMADLMGDLWIKYRDEFVSKISDFNVKMLFDFKVHDAIYSVTTNLTDRLSKLNVAMSNFFNTEPVLWKCKHCGEANEQPSFLQSSHIEWGRCL